MLIALGLGGCGGGGGGSHRVAHVQPLPFAGASSGPSSASAGGSDAYQPTGRIVADDGFRPPRDAFGFENYGSGGVELDTTALVDLFGPGVCLNGSLPDCQVSPEAQRFAQQWSSAMAGGHCYGFSVAVLRFFKHVVRPSQYGAATVAQLAVRGNPQLQRLIAESWLTQALTSVQAHRIAGTPNDVLDALIRELRSGDDVYTLAIANKRPIPQPHAITPYAVEDKGSGRFAVLAYDSNFPLITRAVMFDRNSDTWRYHANPSPVDPEGLYQGGADNVVQGGTGPQLALEPMRPGLARLTCDFCGPSPLPWGGRRPLPGYAQIALETRAAVHAHLLVTDSRGRRTGIVGGRLLREIPGSQVLLTSRNQDWRESSEPVYRIPAGIRVTVTLEGTASNRREVDNVSLVSRGSFEAVDGIAVASGQRPRLSFGGRRLAVSYGATAAGARPPVLRLGAQVGRVGFEASAGPPRGASLRVEMDPRARALSVRTAGSGTYGLTLARLAPNRAPVVAGGDVRIARGSTATLGFGALRRSRQPLSLSIHRGSTRRRARLGG